MLTNPVTRKATGHQFLRNYCQLAVLLLQLGVRTDGHADPAAPALFCRVSEMFLVMKSLCCLRV